MKQSILNTIAIAIMLVILVGMLYIFYLLLEPFKFPTLDPNPIPILNKGKIIHYNEGISTKVHYCIFKKVSSITTRRIESQGADRRVYFLSTSVNDGTKPGCGTVTSNTLPVPDDIPAGTYKIILDAKFHVNSLKEVAVTYETESFTVRESTFSAKGVQY